MKFLRPMCENDIDQVVEVIESHDEDDAEEAGRGYRLLDGVSNQYVLEHEGQLIGVTGYYTPPNCEGTYWLSWTYIQDDYTGNGHGRRMMTDLLQHVKELGGRKIFLKISNYQDPEDGDVYGAAWHLFQSLGFTLELTNENFYDIGEAQRILSMRVRPVVATTPLDEYVPVRFNAVFEIAETDGAYTFGWREDGDALFTKEDVEVGLNEVKSDGARVVFLTFPSNFSGIREPLVQAGFREHGLLGDYFEDGVHELHFVYYFCSLP